MEYQELAVVRRYNACQPHAMDDSFGRGGGAHKKKPDHGKEDGGETREIGLTESRQETMSNKARLMDDDGQGKEGWSRVRSKKAECETTRIASTTSRQETHSGSIQQESKMVEKMRTPRKRMNKAEQGRGRRASCQ